MRVIYRYILATVMVTFFIINVVRQNPRLPQNHSPPLVPSLSSTIPEVVKLPDYETIGRRAECEAFIGDHFVGPPLKKMTLVRVPRQRATIFLATEALKVHGDFVEAGVFKGGTAFLMAAVLACNNETERRLWLADSYRGLPDPTWHAGDMAETGGGKQANWKGLSKKWTASVDTVMENFASQQRRWRDLLMQAPEGTPGKEDWARGGRAQRFGHFDFQKQAGILEGWFKDTLKESAAKIGSISFLRCDADMYSSTKECLVYLYTRVSSGGLVYIDDYWEFEACRRAVDEFRAEQDVDPNKEPLYTIMEDGSWHFVKSMTFEAVNAHKRNTYPRGTLERHIDAVFWRKR